MARRTTTSTDGAPLQRPAGARGRGLGAARACAPPPISNPLGVLGDILLQRFEEITRRVVGEELDRRLGSLRPEPAGTPPYLNAAKAAEIAGVTAATVREWVRQGKLAGHRAGRGLRVTPDDLSRFLASGEGSVTGPDASDIESRKRAALARLK